MSITHHHLPTITIYAEQDTPRLRYVLDWLFTERLGLDYTITHDSAIAATASFAIAYGYLPAVFSVPDTGLLFEQGISKQFFLSYEWQGLYAPFYTNDALYTVPFDLFGGIFYFLSRYEEYPEQEVDKHGRFPAGKSRLAVDGVLERPVLDEWIAFLRQYLEREWQLSIPVKPITFFPTYDIDIAWSYRHKGAQRLIGAGLKDLLRRNFCSFFLRMRVIAGKASDPYDAYEWMEALHQKYGLTPRYFILAALQSSPFDKNIHPQHPAMQRLIGDLLKQGTVGMHPSYFTDSSFGQFTAEKAALEKIIAAPVTTSRQHFIRVFLPATYRTLIAAGITDDYSMGYGTALGFRAGTGHSFYWYDLEREEQTALRVHPFCFMDTTAHFDLELDVQTAFERLEAMKVRLEGCHGVLTTVFHNFSLGSEPQWAGWKEAYEQFIVNRLGKYSLRDFPSPS